MGKLANGLYNIYVPYSNLDWMNYKIVHKQDLTFHHIVKREHGGKAIITNGALLLNVSHNYLHTIERKDFESYLFLNKMFEIINSQLHEPDLEQRETIEYILRDFELKHKEDLNSKGKLLIKREWLNRW